MSSVTATKTGSIELSINEINPDPGQTQMRPEFDEDREAEFAELMKEGVEFDPIVVYRTPEGLLIVDGWTRYGAAMRADLPTIRANVTKGSVEDAIRAAAGANAKSIKPRCKETVKRAVWAIIELDGHERTPDYYAEVSGVSRYIAAKHLDAWRLKNKVEKPEAVTARDGVVRPTKTKKPKGSNLTPSVDACTNGHTPKPKTLIEVLAEEEVQEPAPRPVEVPKAQVDAEDDKAWLEDLKPRTGGPSVREQLPPAKRAKFDEDCLIYRRMHSAGFWQSFANLAVELTGDKKTGGARGANYARLLSWFRRLSHPKDWTLCPACKGTGKHVDGRVCMNSKCYQNGYHVEANG